MRQSQLFTKTRKEAPKDEEAINARFLIRAGFVDKLMAGVYSYLPLGLLVLRKIENIIREEMKNIGGQEILMPALQPKENWQKTGRWEDLDSLMKLGGEKHAGLMGKLSPPSSYIYALGPTHEEIVSPLMKKFVFSYKDLPAYVFQIQNKFRDEKRAKSGLLRGREFVMKDLYSFHTDEKDLDIYYEKAKKSYEKIFKAVGLGKLTYLTYASGGTFSKYSHEFQTLCPSGEDVIFICDKCKIAVNKEIIEDLKRVCPECGNKNLREEKAIEVGNIFKLKTKYSAPFELKYKDKDGKEKDVVMGCYGIGPSRLMGAAAEVFNDEKGIVWPENIAPFKVHLLNLAGQNKKISSEADKLYQSGQKAGVEILYDDRAELTPGQKFADSDLIGIPYRAVISERSGGKIELKKRDSKKAEMVIIKEFLRKMK